MKNRFRLTLFLCIASLGVNMLAYAGTFDSRNEDNFFNKRQEGYFWYLDPPPEEKEKKALPALIPKATLPVPALRETLSEKRMKAFKKQLESAKTTAIMNPTRENIQAYLLLQKKAMDRASVFADQWRRVVWQTPSVNYALRRPTTNAALHTYKDTRFKRVVQVSKDLGKEYGIYFFFKGSCPFCHNFAPVLKMYEKRHGLKVLPVTLDGGPVPGYPNPKFDTRVARMLKVTKVPAVFLVHIKTRKIVPITQGMISYAELQNRVFVLTKTRPGQEF